MAKASTQGPSGVPAEGAELDRQEIKSHTLNMDRRKEGNLMSPVSVTGKEAPCPEKGMWVGGWLDGKAGLGCSCLRVGV